MLWLEEDKVTLALELFNDYHHSLVLILARLSSFLTLDLMIFSTNASLGRLFSLLILLMSSRSGIGTLRICSRAATFSY